MPSILVHTTDSDDDWATCPDCNERYLVAEWHVCADLGD